jgi:predicted amidohydrolase
MLVYSKETFIRAHEDRGDSYKNHSYNRYVRDAICNKCGEIIGEQVKYSDFDKEFYFEDEDKRVWKYCPICAEKLL